MLWTSESIIIDVVSGYADSSLLSQIVLSSLLHEKLTPNLFSLFHLNVYFVKCLCNHFVQASPYQLWLTNVHRLRPCLQPSGSSTFNLSTFKIQVAKDRNNRNNSNNNNNKQIPINTTNNRNVIQKCEPHNEKHFQPKINFLFTISVGRPFWRTNLPFSLSVEIDDKFVPRNAESSMNWTFRGMTIDWSDEHENANDSIRVNREFDSNMIDESD
jgi:hypothetical protein